MGAFNMAEAAIDARPKKSASLPKALPIAAAVSAAAIGGAAIGYRIHEGQVPPSNSAASSGPDNGHPSIILPTATMPSEQALAQIATVAPDAPVPTPENTLAYVREPFTLYESAVLPFAMASLDTWSVQTLMSKYGPVDIFTGEEMNGDTPKEQVLVYIVDRKVDPQTGQELTPEQYMEELIKASANNGAFTAEALDARAESLPKQGMGVIPGVYEATFDSYDGLAVQLLRPSDINKPAIFIRLNYVRAVNPTTGETDNWVFVERTTDMSRAQTTGNILDAIDLYPTPQAPATT